MWFFVGIEDNETREKIQKKLEKIGVNIPVLIHPNAVIGEDVQIGTGTVVMAEIVQQTTTAWTEWKNLYNVQIPYDDRWERWKWGTASGQCEIDEVRSIFTFYIFRWITGTI